MFNRKGKLYLEYFHPILDKKVQRSTSMNDTPENREEVVKNLIPKLQAEIAILSKNPQKFAPIKKNFAHYAELYLRRIEENETWRETGAKVKKIVAYFDSLGKEPLEITANDIETFLFGLNVGPKTMRNYKTVIGSIFKYVLKDCNSSAGTINPVTLVELPAQKSEEEIEPFTAEEVALLLIKCEEVQFKNFLALSFFTGARPGELLGLMPRDIDFAGGTISIRRQMTKGREKNRLKTKGSERVIPLFEDVAPYIHSQLAYAADKKSMYLFCREDGSPVLSGADGMRGKVNSNLPESQQGPWYKLLKSCGLEYRRMYQTRHTFITNALESGRFTVNEVAQIVGHTSAEMIYKTYNRFIKGQSLKIDKKIRIFESLTLATDTDSFGGVKNG
jgi:integrase